jgi:hypothetical protein
VSGLLAAATAPAAATIGSAALALPLTRPLSVPVARPAWTTAVTTLVGATELVGPCLPTAEARGATGSRSLLMAAAAASAGGRARAGSVAARSIAATVGWLSNREVRKIARRRRLALVTRELRANQRSSDRPLLRDALVVCRGLG